MASRANSRLISNSYAHQADRSAAPSNMQQQQHQQAPRRQQQRFLHGSMARRAPAILPSSSIAAATAATSSSSTTTTTSSSTAGPAAAASAAAGPAAAAKSPSNSPASDEDDDDDDIILRDERGEYRLDGDPGATPPLPRDEARDERELESRLIETFRQHHEQIEPAELRRTLQASLAAKVAGLDRDAWMFEGEDVAPVESP